MRKLLICLFAWMSSLGLLAQTKESLFTQVKATPSAAVGDIYYTDTTSGTIKRLGIGSSTQCLWVGGSSRPIWATCGTITSVGITAPSQFNVTGSPFTSGGGTLALAWANVSANFALMGPTTGSAAAPSFRALNRLDLQSSGLAFAAAGVGHAYGLVPDPGATAHSPKWLLQEDSTWAAPTFSGTVTSVDLSVPSGFTTSGGPVTGSGTLTLGLSNQTGSKWFGNHTGIGAPSFLALSGDDVPLFTTSARGTVSAPPTNTHTTVLFDDNVWATPGGGGTVTSIILTTPSGVMSVSGGSTQTISGTGTFALTFPTVVQRQFLASPVNSSGSGTWRSINWLDEPVMVSAGGSHAGGRVPDPGTALHTPLYYLDESGAFSATPGGGSVTSVDLAVPTGFSTSGGPVTVSGTLTLGFSSVTGASGQAKFLASPCGGGSGTVSFRIQCGSDFPVMTAAGGSHAGGAVGDPGAVAHTPAWYWGDDAAFHTMPYTGTVTSVGLTMPSWYSVSGSPNTSTGTFAVTAATGQTANRFLATPDGSTGAVGLRSIAPGDLAAVPCASGARGSVPATGGGTTQFLRADCSFAVPGAGATIEVKQIGGVSPPDYTGVSLLEVDQATGLTLSQPNGAGTARITCSSCGGGGSSAVVKTDEYTGNGSSTAFTLTSTPTSGGIIDVFVNGLSEKTSHWSISGTTLTLTYTAITGTAIKAVYYTTLPGTSTHIIEDFTATASQTDFTLSHAPTTDGIIGAFRNGVLLKNTQWSIVSSTTFRLATGANLNDVVSVTYNY